jgi:hypothetical protein
MKKKKVSTLTEALQLIQELDYVPGVSMAVPDFNYTVNKRRNFDTQDRGGEFPYDEEGDGVSGGPQNAQGDGQAGVGRGGVGLGGRPDHSGGIRQPSAAYTATWDHTDEGADWDEEQRHGGDRRNLWRDTPDGQTLQKQVKQGEEELPESMGAPMQTGPVAPMDGPQHNVLNFSGSVSDMLPQDDKRGTNNMWGGAGTIPGGDRGWASSPTMGDDPNSVWNVPKESTMRLKEFFDPSPIETEPLSNQGQDYLNDATDDELEDRVNPGQDDAPPRMGLNMFRDDHDEQEAGDDEEQHAGGVEGPEGDGDEGSFAGRYGGETIMMMPNVGHGVDFMMSPDKFGAARGNYGMHTDGNDRGSPEVLDKRSAWDVLQHVITAMAKSLSTSPEKQENEENTDVPG